MKLALASRRIPKLFYASSGAGLFIFYLHYYITLNKAHAGGDQNNMNTFMLAVHIILFMNYIFINFKNY